MTVPPVKSSPPVKAAYADNNDRRQQQQTGKGKGHVVPAHKVIHFTAMIELFNGIFPVPQLHSLNRQLVNTLAAVQQIDDGACCPDDSGKTLDVAHTDSGSNGKIP
jgi:hypothetical protein